jgi:uncharacterized protein (TIGR00661 family)
MKLVPSDIKNILITPLSWGLGHAGRMIPVAMRLKEMGHNVTVAGDEEALSLFRYETTGIDLISFPGFRMHYSRYLSVPLTVLVRIPSIIFHSITDHYKLRSLIKDLKINIVISDNRFGCWNKSIKSVYITHQLRIIFPLPFRFLEPIGIAFHNHIINKYDLCLVPDFPGEPNISGELSHNMKLPRNVRYVGLLSRFSSVGNITESHENQPPYISIILSGPEPQKSILRQKLLNVLSSADYCIKIFEARPGLMNRTSNGEKIVSFNHVPSVQMRDIIMGSEIIICRSGYTTIMEMISLGKTAILIPTPGQTEQEYLAEYLSGRGWFSFVAQDKISIPSEKQNGFPHEQLKMSEVLLLNTLKELSE